MTAKILEQFSAPHIWTKYNTHAILRDRLIAISFVALGSLWIYRVQSLLLLGTCLAAALVSEFISELISKNPLAGKYKYAAFIGIAMALVLPGNFPLPLAALGSVLAIVVGSRSFLGLGSISLNAVLLARAFLATFFPAQMERWVATPVMDQMSLKMLDAISRASPLNLARYSENVPTIKDLLGWQSWGALGEVSVIMTIAAGVFLLYRRAIDYRMSLGLAAGVYIIAQGAHLIDPAQIQTGLFHLFSGGVLFVAVFLIGESAQVPVTKRGRWIFGIGCAIITMIIRLWGSNPEGVMYAVLIMNLLTPYIERACQPRQYGQPNHKKEKGE